MTDKEFYDWFVERAEKFADLGIMHPNSEWGKIAKICVVVMEERFTEMQKEIDKLKSDISSKSVDVKEKQEKPVFNKTSTKTTKSTKWSV